MSITRVFDLLDIIKKRKDSRFSINLLSKEKIYSLNKTDYINKVNILSSYLLNKGVEKHDKIINISTNRLEWNIVDMSVMQIGAVHVPLFYATDIDVITKVFNELKPKMVFVYRNNTIRKLLKLINENIIPETIIISYNKIDGYDSIQDIINDGNSFVELDKIQEIKKNISENDIASINYLSGDVNNAKGVVLSHKNICSNFISVAKLKEFNPKWKALSYLPINHLFERSFNYIYHLLDIPIYYIDISSSLYTSLKIIKPEIIVTVPLFLENIIKQAEQNSTTKKQVCNNINDLFGGNIKQVFCGGAYLDKDISDKILEAGIQIIEGYGLTELSPVVTANSVSDYKIGTVGKAIDCVEIKIAEDGEILVKSSGLMQGYFAEEQTQLNDDGFFKTGDIGYIDNEGFLTIISNKKDYFKTSSGFYNSKKSLLNNFKGINNVSKIDFFKINSKGICLLFSINFSKDKASKEFNNVIKIVKEKVEKYNKTVGNELKISSFEFIEKNKNIEKDISIIDTYNKNCK